MKISTSLRKTMLAGMIALLAAGAFGTALTPSPRFSIGITQAAAASKLGDLRRFRTIVVDTAALVDKGEMPAATKRIKDLETAWDEAEAGLKPRAAGEWHKIDKSIDGALTALRASKPDQATSKKALTVLLATIDGA